MEEKIEDLEDKVTVVYEVIEEVKENQEKIMKLLKKNSKQDTSSSEDVSQKEVKEAKEFLKLESFELLNNRVDWIIQNFDKRNEGWLSIGHSYKGFAEGLTKEVEKGLNVVLEVIQKQGESDEEENKESDFWRGFSLKWFFIGFAFCTVLFLLLKYKIIEL